jgi:hypothetical protein
MRARMAAKDRVGCPMTASDSKNVSFLLTVKFPNDTEGTKVLDSEKAIRRELVSLATVWKTSLEHRIVVLDPERVSKGYFLRGLSDWQRAVEPLKEADPQ